MSIGEFNEGGSADDELAISDEQVAVLRSPGPEASPLQGEELGNETQFAAAALGLRGAFSGGGDDFEVQTPGGSQQQPQQQDMNTTGNFELSPATAMLAADLNRYIRIPAVDSLRRLASLLLTLQ